MSALRDTGCPPNPDEFPFIARLALKQNESLMKSKALQLTQIR